jgi:hypothetical protein
LADHGLSSANYGQKLAYFDGAFGNLCQKVEYLPREMHIHMCSIKCRTSETLIVEFFDRRVAAVIPREWGTEVGESFQMHHSVAGNPASRLRPSRWPLSNPPIGFGGLDKPLNACQIRLLVGERVRELALDLPSLAFTFCSCFPISPNCSETLSALLWGP